ncbi:MAG: VWA domain-containing protein [Gemmatirosa sp.]
MDATWLRHFQEPWLLPAIVLLPVLVVALLVTWARRRAVRAARLGEQALVARLAPEVADTRVRWRMARLGLAALLAGIALAGPRWGLARNVVRSSGIDVVLALDASLSMLAQDERPSRLERLKQEVRRLRALSTGDRTALIAFAGRSYILTPLTTDQGALALFLDNLDPSVVGQAGSSLARAIRQATDLLQVGKSGSDRAIVLMSDGEAFEPVEEVEAAAREAAEAGISLVTVGFGSEAGATIPVREGNSVSEKRDSDGAIVVTRYSPRLLAAAAQAARDTFIPAEATDKAARVRAALSGLRAQRRALDAGEDLVPRFQWFLAPALLLLVLDTVAGARRPRGVPSRAALRRLLLADPNRPPRAATSAMIAAAWLPLLGAASALLVSACGVSNPLAGRDADAALLAYRRGDLPVALAEYRDRARGGSPLARYNLGTVLVASDSLDAARAPLDEARRAREPEIRWRAHFNLGLAHLERGLAMQSDSARGELDAALALYKRALLMRPADADAKWNYELALRKRQEQSGGGGGGGGGGGESDSQGTPPPDAPPQQQPRPAGGLGQRQAEELLNAAARDERDVQGRRQRQNPPPPPPGGKDW